MAKRTSPPPPPPSVARARPQTTSTRSRRRASSVTERADERTSSPRAVDRHAGSERARTAQQEAQQREASEQTLVEATQDERRCGDERHVRRAGARRIEGWTRLGE